MHPEGWRLSWIVFLTASSACDCLMLPSEGLRRFTGVAAERFEFARFMDCIEFEALIVVRGFVEQGLDCRELTCSYFGCLFRAWLR